MLLLSLIGQELSIDQSGLCGEIKVFLSVVTRWEYRREVKKKKKLRDRGPHLAFCVQVTTVFIFLQGNGIQVEDRCLKRKKISCLRVFIVYSPACSGSVHDKQSARCG